MLRLEPCDDYIKKIVCYIIDVFDVYLPHSYMTCNRHCKPLLFNFLLYSNNLHMIVTIALAERHDTCVLTRP